MKTENLNLKASNTSGARANYSYGNMLDQMRYIYALRYINDKEVLDVACGVGWGSYLIGMAGAKKVTSIDLSEEAIKTAKKYYSNFNIEYICNYLEKSKVADSSIDVITSFETFEHLENPKSMLDEFYKVIKPNGVLLLSTPNAHAFKYKRDDSPHNPYHFQEYYKEDINQIIKDKWDIIEYKGQYSMLAESSEVFKYRKWIRDYYIQMSLSNKIGVLGKVIILIFRKLNILTLNEPAFSGSCEPISIQINNEPAFHYFILKPKKQ